LEGVTDAGEITDEARDNVMKELRRHFRPEFLNRVDDIVLFKPLTLDEVKQIVGLLAQDLARRLKDRRIKLDLSDDAREFIAKAGYDPVYGARPLKRYLQHQLESRIGRAIISGSVPDGSTIHVNVQNDELVVTHTEPEK
ncbi:MAG: type VI secretion system ATPase TssH, partial [Desulfoferrobacter sp.]